MGILVFGVVTASFSLADSTRDLYNAHGRLTDWGILLGLCLNLGLLAFWDNRLKEIRARHKRWEQERAELDLISDYISDVNRDNDWAKLVTRLTDLGLRPETTKATKKHCLELLTQIRQMDWKIKTGGIGHELDARTDD